jgi:hypothetical protein
MWIRSTRTTLFLLPTMGRPDWFDIAHRPISQWLRSEQQTTRDKVDAGLCGRWRRGV